MTSRRVLLCDLDLSLGMASFYLKLRPAHSIVDALQYAGKLDETLWEHFIASRGNLDITGACGLAGAREPEPDAVLELIRFARRMYGVVVIDFSGNLEPWTIELLRQATQIFLVATHEIPALHLARAKADALRDLQVHDRVSVLLNRTEPRESLSVTEIERILSFRVRASFQNEYKRVNDATLNGMDVDAKSPLGREFAAFAAGLCGKNMADTAPAPRRKFLEFFSVAPTVAAVERQRS
jgi:pilus assembly protein CpaE